MRIHHLNCGTMCPHGRRLMDGADRGPGPARLVCQCLLIETDAEGLVLVDTGIGLGDVRTPRERLSDFFIGFNRIQLREEETAVRQVERLGFKAADVRHIVLTHLDFDHAGGLSDFPQASVHLLDQEADAALNHRRGFIAERRYRPQQWGDTARWRRYRPEGEPWFGFETVRALEGLPPEILMVPLPGHTSGHAGVAVRNGAGWLLLAGDAYFHKTEMDPAGYRCPPGLRFYQKMMEVDRARRLHNQERLRGLVREQAGVRVLSSHDAVELETARAAAHAA